MTRELLLQQPQRWQVNETEVGLHREGRRTMHLASPKEDTGPKHCSALLSSAGSTRQSWKDSTLLPLLP